MVRVAKCSCGTLVAECAGEPVRVIMCNCLECQRRTGSVFGVGAYFPRNQVCVTGAATKYQRSADSGRTLRFNFCGACGTTLYWELDAYPDVLGLAVGAKHEWVALPESMAQHLQSSFKART